VVEELHVSSRCIGARWPIALSRQQAHGFPVHSALRETGRETVMDFDFATSNLELQTGDFEGIALDRRALDSLFSAAYEELKRLAAIVRRSDSNATLSPTTLVNEAWLKLSSSPSFDALTPLHFKRIAARAMRQVLVDAARRKKATRRGGDTTVITFDESVGSITAVTDELMALDAAMKDLALINPRQAVTVEMRFFGGLGIPEIAELLHVSEATVLRDWRAARAWLARELRGS
jgi:RNA polymerase sigma factor (TIGR02999 family)